MNENKIDMGNLEKAVAEVTDSIAVGKFVVKAFEAAMNLRAGLSREQTSNAMLSHQAECLQDCRLAGAATLTTLLVCFLTSMSWKSSRK